MTIPKQKIYMFQTLIRRHKGLSPVRWRRSGTAVLCFRLTSQAGQLHQDVIKTSGCSKSVHWDAPELEHCLQPPLGGDARSHTQSDQRQQLLCLWRGSRGQPRAHGCDKQSGGHLGACCLSHGEEVIQSRLGQNKENLNQMLLVSYFWDKKKKNEGPVFTRFQALMFERDEFKCPSV